jgi:RNA polymerase sigma factor (sigma-70 family)
MGSDPDPAGEFDMDGCGPSDNELALMARTQALKVLADLDRSQEVAQDVMVILYALPERPRFPRAWVRATAHNRAVDVVRRRDRQVRLERVADERPAMVEDEADQILARIVVTEAIRSLPARQRQAMECCRLQGLDHETAAKQMGISLNTLKKHLFHGMASLRAYLSDEDDDEGGYE